MDGLAELDRRLVVEAGERDLGRPLAAIAKAFELDFEQLWSTGDVARSGFVDPRWDDGVRAWMTPGHGEELSIASPS